ncbi:DUF4440 domain-containing protein [Comamonas sp. GB3 AK4-5]|uniref:DUF4440 domain-containing protein n=1 Tax=Comamonas sp. GB3 AK4-5 TaxID=3231487 RepID=UPI00351EC678
MHKQATVDAAKRSILRVHELIHCIFTGEAEAAHAALQQLMPLFSEDFSMVATSGQVVGLHQVEQAFARAAGSKPGLRMEVSDMEPVWQDGSHIAMRYRETHHLNGLSTVRCSVVLLHCAEQAVRWNYLHETALA